MKPDIFEIFRTFSRYLEKQSGISGNIFTRFFVKFLSRPVPESVHILGMPRVLRNNSKIQLVGEKYRE